MKEKVFLLRFVFDLFILGGDSDAIFAHPFYSNRSFQGNIPRTISLTRLLLWYSSLASYRVAVGLQPSFVNVAVRRHLRQL
jgi:hypothetical protein